uniref:PfkB family carbohydrate kinase n=1 Tax=Bacteroidota TaxID=976 RepID=UPI0040477839
MKTTFISGNFNILHPGHLRLLRFAKELGNRLVVCILSDELAGKSALVPENLRLESVQSNNWVDEAFISNKPVSEVIRQLKPDIIVKGKEHEGQFNPEAEVVKEYGGKLIFSSGEVIFSSFDLIMNELQTSLSSFTKLPADYLMRHNLEANVLRERVIQFNKLRLIVIGDLIVDEYITCDPLGMSQEDPTIVVTPIESKKFIGGAGIVAAHAAGLGAKVSFLSITGDDTNRDFAVDKLNSFKVDTHLYKDDSRPTTLKQRYRCKGKTLLRVSQLHKGAIEINIQNEILSQIDELIKSCDLLIFSDFSYGCLPTEMVEKIIAKANKFGVYLVADSQSSSQIGDISRFKGMSLLTPTEREARLGVRDYESGLVVLAEKLREQSNAGNIFLKIGEDGVLIHAKISTTENWLTDRIPALNPLPVDVAGAGDSMMVVGAMALACGSSIWEAAALGSIAAAVQVSRVGNTPLTGYEIIKELER